MCIRDSAYVVERLGAFHSTWGTGLHIKIPFSDRIAKKVSLKEQVVDFPPQPVITKDNVTMQIDTVVYFQITDPKPVSYTHLDVYKRQAIYLGWTLPSQLNATFSKHVGQTFFASLRCCSR